MPHLHQRIQDAPFRGSFPPPTAPGEGERQNHQKDSHADQEKVWTGVPEIVNGINFDRESIERVEHSNHACAKDSRSEKNLGFASSGPIAQDYETRSHANESKRCPRKNWEEPCLRLVESVDAVDVRLERPGKPTRSPRRIEQWSQQSNCKTGKQPDPGVCFPPTLFCSRRKRCGRGIPAAQTAGNSHQNHGEANHVEHIDAEQVGPRRPSPPRRIVCRAIWFASNPFWRRRLVT